jgi:hypothetical protein
VYFSLGCLENKRFILMGEKIMLAAYYGHAPLVRLLIQHGANPNSLNDRGQSPLAGAVYKGEDEVIEVCIFPQFSPLFVFETFFYSRSSHCVELSL